MSKNLLDGCSYSELWVNPKNWKTVTSKKALSKNWYVECKFYDPKFKKKYPKGFPFRTRLNGYKDLDERKGGVQTLLDSIPVLLEEKGWNPITRSFMLKPIASDLVVSNTKVIPALRNIHEKIVVSKTTYKDLRQVINNVEKSIIDLNLSELMISELKRGQIKLILDHLALSNSQYNKFLAYLSILIRELVEMEVMEHNPIGDIRKKKTVRKIRETLEIPELIEILNYLKTNYYTFYRYTTIFFHSGARSSELFRIQAKDVNLIKQEYKVTIQKGSYYKEVVKVILPSALPLWIDLLKDVSSLDDYIFSVGLKPGVTQIQEYQITKRWKRLVKDKLNVTADFYSLKHLFLDELDKVSNETVGLAKSMANHTTNVTETVYLVGREKRKNEILKKTRISALEIE